jgi:hypothetical protein
MRRFDILHKSDILFIFYQTKNSANNWVPPVESLLIGSKHNLSTCYKNRLTNTSKIGKGCEFAAKKVLNVISNNTILDNKKKMDYLESLSGVIPKYTPFMLIEKAAVEEHEASTFESESFFVSKFDQIYNIDNPGPVQAAEFILGPRKITFNDDIITEFQFILNALLFTINSKYGSSNSICVDGYKDYFNNFKTLIINGIFLVQDVNKREYIHYEKLEKFDGKVLLQEMFSLLGILRHGVPANSYLVESNISNPFQFQKDIINHLNESDFANLREQLCHLLNSNNQSNRKGQTLIISESFLDWATNEGDNGKLTLSAEEYSRFCQADIFIVNSKFGIIILDLSGQECKVNIFLWVNCDSEEEEKYVKNILENKVEPLYQKYLTYINPFYQELKMLLTDIFERDSYRRSLLVPVIRSDTLFIYPINILKSENLLQNSGKYFITTVMLNVLLQSNDYHPHQLLNSDNEVKDTAAYIYYVSDNAGVGKSTDIKTYSGYISHFFNEFKTILENIVNDKYISQEQEYTSFQDVSTIIMAVLAQYMCYNQSIFTANGMGYDNLLDIPRLSLRSFWSDFISGEINSYYLAHQVLINIIIIISVL